MSENKICDYKGNPIAIDDNVVIVDERGEELDLHPLRELDENAYFLLPSKSERPELYVFGGLFANKNVSYKKKNLEINEKQELNVDNNLKKSSQEQVTNTISKSEENLIEAFCVSSKTQKIEEYEGQNLIPTTNSAQKDKIIEVVVASNYQTDFSESEEQEYYENLKESYEYLDDKNSNEYCDDEARLQEAEPEYLQNEECYFEEESIDDEINNELNAEIFPGENINDIVLQSKELDADFDADASYTNTQIEAGVEIDLGENDNANMIDDSTLSQKNISIENDAKPILEANLGEKENKKPKKFKVEYDEGYYF